MSDSCGSRSSAGDSSYEDLLGLTEDLLRIDSVIEDERVLCDWVEQRLTAQKPHAFIRARNSVCVVPLAPDPDKSTLMLVGHLDTVPKAGENPVRREGDRLYGLGASDMKAGDAIIIRALERALVEAPKHNLIGILYSCEEGPFDLSEMPYIYEAAKPWIEASDLAICMEPTDNQIELGCLGTCHARVTFQGQRAHSARPWHGDNAIHKAADFMARLRDFGKREFTFHGLKFFEVMNATMVEFQGARNVIPDAFEINVNYRFTPGKDEADVRRELTAIIGDEAQYELVDFCPAGRVCGDNRLLAELRHAAGNPETRAKQAWTDVGRLSNLGMDAINWGPGATSQAHQRGEWVSMEAIAQSARVLDAWLYPGADS